MRRGRRHIYVIRLPPPSSSSAGYSTRLARPIIACFQIVDGADDDWASWYSDWLINLSELPSLVGTRPVRSELTYLLVSLDKDYSASQPGEPWETYYAQRILAHFSSSGH